MTAFFPMVAVIALSTLTGVLLYLGRDNNKGGHRLPVRRGRHRGR